MELQLDDQRTCLLQTLFPTIGNVTTTVLRAPVPLWSSFPKPNDRVCGGAALRFDDNFVTMIALQ